MKLCVKFWHVLTSRGVSISFVSTFNWNVHFFVVRLRTPDNFFFFLIDLNRPHDGAYLLHCALSIKLPSTQPARNFSAPFFNNGVPRAASVRPKPRKFSARFSHGEPFLRFLCNTQHPLWGMRLLSWTQLWWVLQEEVVTLLPFFFL